MDITGYLYPLAKLYKIHENPETGMWFLYLTIVVFTIIVFKLGFAKKLPLVKAAVVYIFLILGCTLLTFFSIFLPIAEGLIVAALILLIYKLRLSHEKKYKGNESI